MSSSESSSSSPEPEVIPIKTKGKSKESRGRKQKTSKPASAPSTSRSEHGKVEGTHPRWQYEPPSDATLADHDVDAGDFDWDSVKNNEDVELWLIRIPDGVKPKYFENIKIEPASSVKSQQVGTMVRKYATYDVWSLAEQQQDDQPAIGGEEITGLSCLLPRKRKNGKLYLAPKPITRHIVVSAQAVSPTPNPTAEAGSNAAPVYKSALRQIYPKERLRHRFMPYGAALDAMDVDIEMEEQGKDKSPEKVANQPETEKSKRKRKGDGEVKAKRPKRVH